MADLPSYTELRKQPRINLAEAVPLDRPLSMYIDTCNACNFRCETCPQSSEIFPHGKGPMLLEDFYKLADDIEHLGPLKTCNLFSFGEPLLNPHTPNFVRIVAERKLAEKIVVTTNASLLTEQTARSLVDNGLDYLRVSIYGVTAEKYKERTGKAIDPGALRRSIEFCKAYRDASGGKMHIAVKMLDIHLTDAEKETFFSMFSPVADECFLEPAHNWHEAEERYAVVSSARKTGVCPYPFYTLVVHPDMDVSVCCPDWDKSIIVANLRGQSLRDVWHGEALRSVQIDLLRHDFERLSRCATCTFFAVNAGDDLNALSAEEFEQRITGGK